MPHIGWGSFIVNLYGTLWSLFFALIWLMAWRRTRLTYMLLLTAGWLFLCGYWILLTVTAGPHQTMPRTETADYLWIALIIGHTILGLGKINLLKVSVQLTRAQEKAQKLSPEPSPDEPSKEPTERKEPPLE